MVQLPYKHPLKVVYNTISKTWKLAKKQYIKLIVNYKIVS